GRMAEPEDIHAAIVRELAHPTADDTPSGPGVATDPDGGRHADASEFGSWRAQEGPLDGFAAGQRWLVTAGGTREALDPVRFIGNRSSGRQGIEVALAAAARGAEVTLVVAHVEAGLLAPVTQNALAGESHDGSRHRNIPPLGSREAYRSSYPGQAQFASREIQVIRVGTSAELEEVVATEAPSHDVVVMAAAVSDYRLAEVSEE